MPPASSIILLSDIFQFSQLTVNCVAAPVSGFYDAGWNVYSGELCWLGTAQLVPLQEMHTESRIKSICSVGSIIIILDIILVMIKSRVIRVIMTNF